MKKQSINQKYFQENHITALDFNQSGQYCAVGIKKTGYVRVYKVNKLNQIQSWELVQELKQHTQTVSCIDWAKDDKIISVSHDRSGVVWRKAGIKWEKMLVNIDIKLSILTAKWAPSSKKFALGSSCRTIAIGFYNKSQNCWTISTRNKFMKSPITTISFHPSSNILAVGSSDYSVKIISCSFAKSEQEHIQNSDIEDRSYKGPFQHVDTLFNVFLSIQDVGGWVNHVSFEKSGNSLLVFPHINHFKYYQLRQQKEKIQAKQIDISWNGLPFLSGYVNGHGNIVASGFDKKVAIFKPAANSYQFVQFLDKNEKTGVTNKKGLVSGLKTGIQKRLTIYGQGPAQSDHVNYTRVLNVGRQSTPVSYDINGVIHFWE